MMLSTKLGFSQALEYRSSIVTCFHILLKTMPLPNMPQASTPCRRAAAQCC